MHTLDGAAIGFLVWAVLMLGAVLAQPVHRVTNTDWFEATAVLVFLAAVGGAAGTVYGWFI